MQVSSRPQPEWVCVCESHFNCAPCIFKAPLEPSTLDRCNEIRLHSAFGLKCARNQYAVWDERTGDGLQMRSHHLTHKYASRATFVPVLPSLPLPLWMSLMKPRHTHKSFIMYTTTDNDLWINWCNHLRHTHTHARTLGTRHTTHDSRWDSHRAGEFLCELMQRTH